MQVTASMDILYYAEDPGAANYVVHLPGACEKKGFSWKAICGEKAKSIFDTHGVSSVMEKAFAFSKEALEAFGPRLVVTGTSENPKSFGLSLLSEARKKGIPSIGAVDAFSNARFRFRGLVDDPLAFAPDWLLVPDPWTLQAYTHLGFPEEKIFVCGHPQYDFVRAKADELEGRGKETIRTLFFPKAMAQQVIAVFAAEQPGGLNPEQYLKTESYTLDGRGGTSRNEIVLEEFLDAMALLQQKPYLVLRLPPKAEPEDFSAYLKEFHMVSRREPVLELVFGSDCVFGMSSMLLVEALLLGKPTFSILPREVERDWLPSLRAGLTPCATTRDDLRRFLPIFIGDLKSFSPKNLTSHFIFGSREKAVAAIEDVVRNLPKA